MSELSKFVNNLMKDCIKSEADELRINCQFTPRQEQIFSLFYIEDQKREFISTEIGWNENTIDKELRIIRAKIIKVIECAKKKE